MPPDRVRSASGAALEEAYPAANETWLYCTLPPAVTLIPAPIPSRLLIVPSSFNSSQCAAAGAVVEPHLRGRAQGGGHHVQASVAIEVAHCGAAMPGGRLRGSSRLPRSAPETSRRPGCGNTVLG